MISTLCINANHKAKCEDTVWVKDFGDTIVGGIFDGCSSGKNSHWASQTMAYSFDKFCKEDLDVPTKHHILWGVLGDMYSISKSLELNEDYFLSTALVFYYQKDKKQFGMTCMGDGTYYINNIEYKLDNNNTPDYMAYYINKSHDEIQKYLKSTIMVVHENVNSFQICSDGIDRIEQSQFIDCPTDPLALLLANPGSPNYLERMWNILKRQKFTLGDDLSIISYSTDATTT